MSHFRSSFFSCSLDLRHPQPWLTSWLLLCEILSLNHTTKSPLNFWLRETGASQYLFSKLLIFHAVTTQILGMRISCCCNRKCTCQHSIGSEEWVEAGRTLNKCWWKLRGCFVKNNKKNYWSIVALQCCASFFCTRKLIIHMYIKYPLFFGFPSHLGHHRALSRVPCAIWLVLISYLFYP